MSLTRGNTVIPPGFGAASAPPRHGRPDVILTRGPDQPLNRATARQVLCPPKPSELLNATSISTSRAVFGT
jgi:hypothetical protein